MTLVVFLLVLAVFLTLIGLMQPLASRLRAPLTVILAVAGMLIGAGATFLLQTPLTNAFNDLALSILTLPIGSEVFLYVFLPTLLFQTALTLEVRRLLEDWVPILVLAVLAVVIATFVIGFALAPFGVQPLIVCLIVASIVATTDPSAVVSIFRDISAPRRLGRLIEGESLMNDAAAIALFTVFLSLATDGGAIGAVEVIGGFLLTLVGGCAFGYLATRIGLFLIGIVREHRLAEMSISLAMPYVIFITADQFLGVSGVIAVVFGGLTLNLMGPARLRPEDWDYLTATWAQLAFWAGTLIFTLAAILVPRLLAEATLIEVGLVAVVVVAAFVARAVVLFGILPLLALLGLSPSVSAPYKIVIMWGGLRGSVTLALALSVTENPSLPDDAQRFVAILATGFVLFTLLVQGTTLRRLIRLLDLDRLQPLDAVLRDQIIAMALQNVRESAAQTAVTYNFAHEVVRSEAKRFGERLRAAIQRAEAGGAIHDRDRVTLGLLALAARERDLILEMFRERMIPLRLVDRMLSDASRLIDRTRTGGQAEYERTAGRALTYTRPFRLAHLLQRRLHLAGPLQRRIAQRFELLTTTRIILGELHEFTDGRMMPIHGERIVKLIHEILTRRAEQVEQALEALRLQYPGYAEELERRFIRKMALRREELEYDRLHDDRLIGPDLHRSLKRELSAARQVEDQRPPLDQALNTRDIVRASPLFQDMDEVAVAKVAEALVTVFASPGDVLVRRGDLPESVFFIASGAVEVDLGQRRIRLGRGEMFGEMGVLSRRPRRAEVRAISYATLFRLSQARFLELMASIPPLREHVERKIAERQVLFPGAGPRPRLPA